MSCKKTYEALSEEQIKTLVAAGCTAADWKQVLVTDGFDPACIKNTCFAGQVKIGKLTGKIKNIHGLEKPAGIYNAAIEDCTIAENSRIANIGVHIAGYDIADNVCIENVGTIQTNPGANFANGIEIEVLNEAGGREVVLFDHLSA